VAAKNVARRHRYTRSLTLLLATGGRAPGGGSADEHGNKQEVLVLNETEAMKKVLKEFILDEFLPGEKSDSLENDTPLITGGVLDSIATIKLAGFVEDQYGIELPDDALNAEKIDTIDKIVSLIHECRRE
jgi:acyl carrier protein